MKQALGLVEIEGLSTAIVVADTMAKAANIKIIEIENTKGLGYMTIKATGDVGAVNASVNAARQVALMHGKLVSSKVIARPSDYVEEFFTGPDEPVKQERTAEPEEEDEPEQTSEPEQISELEQISGPEQISEPEEPEDSDQSGDPEGDLETEQEPKKALNSRKSAKGQKKGNTDKM